MAMLKKAYKIVANPFSLIILAVFLISCAHKPNIIGKWQEPGKTSSIEFTKHGTFTAVDDMGMAVSGNYFLQAKGKIRLEIKQSDSTIEILSGSIAVQDDKLILTPEDDKEVLIYRKIRN
jgi:hypothetical protein